MDESFPRSSPPTKNNIKRTKTVGFDASKNTTKKFSIVSLLSFASKSSSKSSKTKLPNLGAIEEQNEEEKSWAKTKKMLVQCECQTFLKH